MRRRLFLAVVCAAFVASVLQSVSARAQSSIPSYYSQLQFNLTSPTARAAAIGGFANPAVYGMLPGFETQFSWSDRGNRFRNIDDWGLFFGAKKIGFGITRDEFSLPGGGEIGVNDYRLALADGNREMTFGVGFGWSGGDDDLVGRSSVFQAGLVRRYGKHVSLGLAGAIAIENSNQVGLFDLAVRPLGDDRVTLFADAELPKGVDVKDAPWSVGAMIEPIRGVQVTGRYFENEHYAFSVGFSLGDLRVAASPRFDTDANTTHTTYEIRTGYTEPSVLPQAATRDRFYLDMQLKGVVKYRAFRYFDDRSRTLYQVLTDLDHAKDDPAISGVAINLSGAFMSRGKAWEIRNKLAELKDVGKHVVIFVDGVTMTQLHLASVADRIVMDPLGVAVIPGYVMGRTFVRDLLAKIGIGFDEWRFLTYKSAAEGFSRTSMSEADREQRLGLIEDLYATVREDVAEGRGVSHAEFDEWIDDQILIDAKQAVEYGIVDAIGRWEDVRKVVAELEGSKKRFVSRRALVQNRVPSRQWGEDPKIAVVYALGACQMDTGIRARQLEKIFQRLRDDVSVRAVVFRVDSPGGLAIASDYVAVPLKQCAERKPVIVSQGDVAASGGYWLSMYGTQIYALPMTIVGSIGVIGGWVWNDGIGDKIGHVADHVKVGEQADYNYGIRLLLSGPRIPDRNLTDEQRQRVIGHLTRFYDDFVDRVADARGMASDEAHAVAKGHVYSGDHGKRIGLVDEIGGLYDAINAAKIAAGLNADDPVEIIELPTMPAFNLSALRPLGRFGFLASWLGGGHAEAEGESDFEWNYIRSIINHPGRPLHMLPPDLYIDEAQTGN